LRDDGRLFRAAAPPSDGSPTRLIFVTDGLASRDGLEAWRAQFGRLNEVIPAPGAAFSARVDYWRVGRFALADTSGSPTRLMRTAERPRRAGARGAGGLSLRRLLHARLAARLRRDARRGAVRCGGARCGGARPP
jgi:hypothetical protein